MVVEISWLNLTSRSLTFGGGVIGNTAGSGPVIEGSSPSPRAILQKRLAIKPQPEILESDLLSFNQSLDSCIIGPARVCPDFLVTEFRDIEL